MHTARLGTLGPSPSLEKLLFHAKHKGGQILCPIGLIPKRPQQVCAGRFRNEHAKLLGNAAKPTLEKTDQTLSNSPGLAFRPAFLSAFRPASGHTPSLANGLVISNPFAHVPFEHA